MLLRVNDTVQVIVGRDRGQTGKILKVDREKNRVTVEGVNKGYKHVRKSQRNPQGGRLHREMPIDASNVMFVEEATGKPTRLGVRYLADGSKERYSKKSGKSVGVISPARPQYAQNS